MYVKRRLKPFRGKELFFYEFASGSGDLSRLLLDIGFQGAGFDLNSGACEKNRQKNKKDIDSGRYKVRNENFFETALARSADLVACCMFLEHLPQPDVERFLTVCQRVLRPEGLLVVLVPASAKHWGVEDEIAGHQRRYEFQDFREMAKKAGWRLRHLTGLTYPLSNWLLPFSNRLVRGHEGHLRNLSEQERTVLSGDRQVPFKTVYPDFLRIFLNPVVLYPFYILQRLFRNHPDSLVIYAELKKVF